MKSEEIKLTSRDLESMSAEFSKLGTDYVFLHLNDMSMFADMSKAPTRLSGLMVLLVLGGEIELEVNLSSYTLSHGNVAVMGRNSLIQTRATKGDKLDVYMLIASESFIRDIQLDMNILTAARVSPTPVNIFRLSEDECGLLIKYLALIHSNTSTNTNEKCIKNISRCIITGVVYQLIQFSLNHPSSYLAASTQRSRRSSYVKDFIRLVHEHHRQERSVSFYASQLYISPKYLSLIAKEITGRSAAEWIDEYVILEAKNLLRYSGKNVQQVAYELNFSNQSSFGKYFKHLTGMSPTEYQKS